MLTVMDKTLSQKPRITSKVQAAYLEAQRKRSKSPFIITMEKIRRNQATMKSSS